MRMPGKCSSGLSMLGKVTSGYVHGCMTPICWLDTQLYTQPLHTALSAGQDKAGFSQGAGVQAMQLLTVHATYGKATAKMRATNELDARQPECRLIGLYDDAATPSQRWDALQPFLLRFGDALLERFTGAWGPDAIAHFAQQASWYIHYKLSGVQKCHNKFTTAPCGIVIARCTQSPMSVAQLGLLLMLPATAVQLKLACTSGASTMTMLRKTTLFAVGNVGCQHVTCMLCRQLMMLRQAWQAT